MINGEKYKTSRVSVGNLYDLNKDLVEKETKPLTQEELAIKKEMVHDFLRENGYPKITWEEIYQMKESELKAILDKTEEYFYRDKYFK